MFVSVACKIKSVGMYLSWGREAAQQVLAVLIYHRICKHSGSVFLTSVRSFRSLLLVCWVCRYNKSVIMGPESWLGGLGALGVLTAAAEDRGLFPVPM